MTDIIRRTSWPFATRYHAWRVHQTAFTMLLLALAWACLMGLLAQVRVPLPFTPVPFTMQVFGTLLGGVLLGTRYGVLAQAVYLVVGIAVVPWFQGQNGGLDYFLGATGGYLLALPLAALVTGAIVHGERLRPAARTTLAMVAGIATIYALGMVWLAWVLDVSLARAFTLGVAPFIMADAAKAVGAALMARPFIMPPRG